jgi:hypothetical protein
MATPRPFKTVKPNFMHDSRAKARMYAIVGIAVAVFLFALFLQSRKSKDNPVLAMQKSALEAQPGTDANGQQAFRVDAKKGVDQQTITQDAAASYDQTIQSAAKEAEAQRQREDQQRQEDSARQVKEAQDRAMKQSRGELPGSVRGDGTAGPSNAQGPEAPQAQPDPRLQVPPEAPYDQRKWVVYGNYRMRPAYQANDLYPASPEEHSKLDSLYFSGASAATTVGMDPNTLQEMKRLTEDFAETKGSIGVRKHGRLPSGAVNVVAPRRPPTSGNFGDWITVTPLPKGGKVHPGTSNGGGAR